MRYVCYHSDCPIQTDEGDTKMHRLLRLLTSDVTDKQIAASPPASRERMKLVFTSFRPTLIFCSALVALFALAKLADSYL